MIEKGLNPYRAYIRQRLCTLFLFTTFISPERIQREISKYLELPSDNIRLQKENEKDDNLECRLQIDFADGLQEFTLLFNRKEATPKTIEIPKVVKKKTYWWQNNDSENDIIIEKKETLPKSTTYWILSGVS